MPRKLSLNLVVIFLFLFFFSMQNAIGKTFASNDSIKTSDTNYYRKYSDRLIISLWGSDRSFDIFFHQSILSDSSGNSSLSYNAEANHITGVDISYDKFSFSLGLKATPPEDQLRKGKTTYRNLGFTFGGNKWILETSYRGYKGFYDGSSDRYLENFDSTSQYYQNPSMSNSCLRGKFLYFTNHRKFSYKSSYSGSYRQLKSAITWVLIGNLYYNQLSTDSSFIPYQVRPYYGQYEFLNGLNTTGFSVGGGFSGNLILWKSVFFNLTFALAPEIQWQTYSYFPNAQQKKVSYNFSSDLRVALGLNFKNFFFSLFSANDRSAYGNEWISVSNTFLSGGAALAYRFPLKAPAIYKKFQLTKLYNRL